VAHLAAGSPNIYDILGVLRGRCNLSYWGAVRLGGTCKHGIHISHGHRHTSLVRVGRSEDFPPNLSGVHLIGVCLMGVYLMGVYIIDMYLTGVYLMGRTSHRRIPHACIS